MPHHINIIAGENIPYVHEAFGGLGNLTILPGRSINAADLKGSNILLIRSITAVNKTLLQGTPVEFVGSATAGINHMDTAYLNTRNIEFASAAGSNANSVAEYVMAALLHLGKKHAISLQGKSIGIIGVGHIGKLVKQKAEALGMHSILNDPPLAETGQIQYHSLEETLGCDVVTLHTPLTIDGPYPTYHLINDQTLKFLKPSAIFINAARGEVVQTQALLDAITHHRIGPTIIDVWEHEPKINWDLFQAVTLGTPHIAGHSLDAKANGTFMIYTALCKHLDIEPRWDPIQSLPPAMMPFIEKTTSSQSNEVQIQHIVTKIYDIAADYTRMQQLLDAAQNDRPALFDALRKNYPVRREFHRTAVKLSKSEDALQQLLATLGFQS